MTDKFCPTPLQRSRVGRWRPFPEEHPDPDRDCRYLVVLTTGDMNWIGIRTYDFYAKKFVRTVHDHNEEVYWFTPLLLDGELSPPVPNAAEQAADPANNYHKSGERILR